MTVFFKDLAAAQIQNFLQHAVAPRPVCFASTINKRGEVNLAPFSYFNVFSSNPPVLIFSPARRVRDNGTKHTLQNVEEVPEVVINMVHYDMVQQMSLASCEFAAGVNEFEKAGFTMQAATLVRPPMVAESHIKMECRVTQILPLGTEGGAGNLVFAEVLAMHIADEILTPEGTIDQLKTDLVARMGGNWYSRANAQSMFEVAKPNTQLGMGVDALPTAIRQSKILTGNDLGMLANVHALPDVQPAFSTEKLKNIVQYYSLNPAEMEAELHLYAQEFLRAGNVADAWQVLLIADNY